MTSLESSESLPITDEEVLKVVEVYDTDPDYPRALEIFKAWDSQCLISDEQAIEAMRVGADDPEARKTYLQWDLKLHCRLEVMRKKSPKHHSACVIQNAVRHAIANFLAGNEDDAKEALRPEYIEKSNAIIDPDDRVNRTREAMKMIDTVARKTALNTIIFEIKQIWEDILSESEPSI